MATPTITRWILGLTVTVIAVVIIAGCGSEDSQSDKAFDAVERCIETAETKAQLDSCMRWTK